MTKIYDVILKCLISAAFFVSLYYVVISIKVNSTDEAMKAQTRIQLIKNYYVTVVFLAQ